MTKFQDNDLLQPLKDYVAEAEPLVNKLLRKGKTEIEGLFDHKFTVGDTPETLYRYQPNCDVNISEDGIFCDKGYLSCSDDASGFISKVDGQDIACLIIKMPSKTSRIVVGELLTDHNDEGEYILPRGLKFKITRLKQYKTKEELDEFIESFEIRESSQCLKDMYKINSITTYELIF